jgi:hypothetical protein
MINYQDPKMDYLSKPQKRALNKLVKGAVMITSSDSSTVLITGHGSDYELPGSQFWDLSRRCIIFQAFARPFDWQLSEVAKERYLQKV